MGTHLKATEHHLPYGITYVTQENVPHLDLSRTRQYLIYISQRDGRLSEWLVVYREVFLTTFFHPSSNWGRCIVTSLIKSYWPIF